MTYWLCSVGSGQREAAIIEVITLIVDEVGLVMVCAGRRMFPHSALMPNVMAARFNISDGYIRKVDDLNNPGVLGSLES